MKKQMKSIVLLAMMITVKEANSFILNQKIEILNRDEVNTRFNLTEDRRHIEDIVLHQKSQGQEVFGTVKDTSGQGELFTIVAKISACKVQTGQLL